MWIYYIIRLQFKRVFVPQFMWAMFVKQQWFIPSNPCHKSGIYLNHQKCLKIAKYSIFQIYNYSKGPFLCYVSTFLELFWPIHPFLAIPKLHQYFLEFLLPTHPLLAIFMTQFLGWNNIGMVPKKQITLGCTNQLEVHKLPLPNIIILIPTDSLLFFLFSVWTMTKPT